MKKFLCVLILIFLITCVVTPCVATAQGASHALTYTPAHKGYTLSTLIKDDAPVGVRFYGYYFGASGIAVQAEIYSSAQKDLGFYIGDEDFSETQEAGKFYLTAEQTRVKHEVLQMFENIHKLIGEVDSLANTQYDGANNFPLSDVYRYNAAKLGQTLEIDEKTFDMLKIAKEMYRDTNKAFNPAVYRLVDLWGFSSRIFSFGNFGLPYDRPVTGEEFVKNGYPLPDEKYVAAFSDPSFTDFSDETVTLTQNDNKFFVTKNVAPAVVDGVEYEQWLDLGGIAKGYAVDCIKTIFQQNGYDGYYLDAGASSTALGNGVGGGTTQLVWQDPFDPAAWILPTTLLGIDVRNVSVSTSGQYVRKYTVDGVEYSHIIDGTTGAPAQTGVKMVAVVVPADEGLWAGKSDCLTTALTVLGKNEIVDFVNGYLKQRNIQVLVAYESFDGKKEICSNIPVESVTVVGDNLKNYAWSLERQPDGSFVYNEAAHNFRTEKDKLYATLAIVLGSVCGAGLVAILVYHFVRGRKRTLQKVQCARRDKPFKPADVGVYLLVVLAIAVLFAVFFSEDAAVVQMVCVVDDQAGEELFVYNVVRNEYLFNENNSNGWKMEIEQSDDGMTVKFTREIDGETRYNTLQIVRGRTPSFTMIDSECGFHKDCVRTFGKVDKSGGVIVCSPNRLKVLAE